MHNHLKKTLINVNKILIKKLGELKMKCKIWELRLLDLEFLSKRESYLNDLYLP